MPCQLPDTRPDGDGAPLHLELFSSKPSAVEIATRTRVERNSAAVVNSIRNAAQRPIVVDIDCWGGLGDGARDIAVALLQHPKAVRTRILGRCASATCLIAVAGDERIIAPTATVMIHGARLVMTPQDYVRLYNMPKPEQDKVLNKLSEADAKCCALLAARTKQSVQVVQGWLRDGIEMNAEQAVRFGIATRVDANG